MNKNFLMATIAGGVTLFVLGYLIYAVLLADFFANDAINPEPIMWAVTLGQFLSAAFLAIILAWKGVANAKEGFQAGAIIGAVMGLAYGLMMYGTMVGMHTIATLLGDTVVSLVVYGVGGAVIAMVLNRGAAEA
ncbi:MAG: hypothetical protein OXE73_09020 [Gammaproteobacteria bacterium]|nr:hypothetical protein [Gammaproteobacteria bacterium]